jgi:aspartate dehydrogenase
MGLVFTIDGGGDGMVIGYCARGALDKPPHMGLIGFGAIGRSLYEQLSGSDVQISVLLRDHTKAYGGTLPPESVVDGIEQLLDSKPDVVVEAAGHAALRTYAVAILKAGVSLIPASTGALGDPDFLSDLIASAESGRARLIIPSGAIGALDYLAALRPFDDVRVTYTSRKPPKAFQEDLLERGIDPATMTTELTLFEGSAAEAAHRYPRNMNSGLTIAFAVGAERTRVRVVADPAVSLNTHEIVTESPLGSGWFRFSNLPSPTNPKSSAITAASLAFAVRRHFAAFMI